MEQKSTGWTFFSNHAHVYFLLASTEDLVLREVASRVGITERSVLAIVQDLVDSGYIAKEKVGRSNRYKILTKKNLRHPLESKVKVKDLVGLIRGEK